MFDINGFEFAIIALLALLLIGPERLPEYAAKLREWARMARDAFAGARDTIGAEVGDDVDWKQYDPRQYDPRRIVREAFAEDAAGGAAGGVPSSAPASATAAPVAAGASSSASPSRATNELQTGDPAPFDTDAT